MKTNKLIWEGPVGIVGVLRAKKAYAQVSASSLIIKNNREENKIILEIAPKDISQAYMTGPSLLQGLLIGSQPAYVQLILKQSPSKTITLIGVQRFNLVGQQQSLELLQALNNMTHRQMKDLDLKSKVAKHNEKRMRVLAVVVGFLGLTHYWTTQQFGQVELGATIFVTAFIVGETINFLAKRLIARKLK